jgi:hypothetical protein
MKGVMTANGRLFLLLIAILYMLLKRENLTVFGIKVTCRILMYCKEYFFKSYLFFFHISEECVEEVISFMSKLYSALETEGEIGKNCKNTKLRAQVLKTLYKFVESSNEILLLHIARIILAVSK